MDPREDLHGIAERVSGSASVMNVYADPVVVRDCTVIPAAMRSAAEVVAEKRTVSRAVAAFFQSGAGSDVGFARGI